jgi:hypothetical protein
VYIARGQSGLARLFFGQRLMILRSKMTEIGIFHEMTRGTAAIIFINEHNPAMGRVRANP